MACPIQQQCAPKRVHFRPIFAHVPTRPVTSASELAARASLLNQSEQARQTQQPQLKVNFAGTWIKDKAASDSMSEAIGLMGLGGLMRQAIKLIKGVKITQDNINFTMAVFSVFSWFKVSESYPLDGATRVCRRRDFRKGGHRGYVKPIGFNKLQLHLQWDDPHGGVGTDVFSMPKPDVLHIDSSITVRGKTCKYRSVYNRKQ
eukprot:GHRR01003653.1.p1 GENE.GHRR01003653.1~~GHRR01003653.1.p1  ORF type:complete len:203 (+),score=55.18 GHRR01003653.1:301-909(+)